MTAEGYVPSSRESRQWRLMNDLGDGDDNEEEEEEEEEDDDNEDDEANKSQLKT
jgi:hypothetical protein